MVQDVWINEKLKIEKAQEFWNQWFFVDMSSSVKEVCGLNNVTFYKDSALATKFTGNSIFPAPYPSDPNASLSINTKTAGTVSFYVVGTTYGNK